MKIPNWLRYFPHPNYGKWGGRKNTHDKWDDVEPIDDMDKAFRRHDFSLRAAKNKDDKENADKWLWKSIKKVKPKSLSLYGRLYRLGCLVVFKPKGEKWF